MGNCHVRICEGVRVRFPLATRLKRIVFNPLQRFGGGQRRLIYTLRVFCYP